MPIKSIWNSNGYLPMLISMRRILFPDENLTIEAFYRAFFLNITTRPPTFKAGTVLIPNVLESSEGDVKGYQMHVYDSSAEEAISLLEVVGEDSASRTEIIATLISRCTRDIVFATRVVGDDTTKENLHEHPYFGSVIEACRGTCLQRTVLIDLQTGLRVGLVLLRKRCNLRYVELNSIFWINGPRIFFYHNGEILKLMQKTV